jgi:myo-inositol 2-dehydrogenase / D-chiro-inositol 1-dehydrogenase
MTVSRRLGVGFIGAGPVTQAIHLPTIATLADRLYPAHVMDIDPAIAAEVSDRAGAATSSTVEALLADRNVDIVAVCSPHTFHADQVTAACAAGKKAVLCEKPLATTPEQAARIAEVSAATGVPVIVGAMHAYDPAWRAAREHWGSLAETASLIRSTLYLPPNDEFVNLATDLVSAPAPSTPAGELTPQARAAMVRAGVLGLATHAIPQIRHFMPTLGDLVTANAVPPFGYQLVIADGQRTAELLAVMPGRWSPQWTLRVWGAAGDLAVQYPPSFVLAGSATAILTESGQRRSWHSPVNGYQAEWAHVADVAERGSPPAVPTDQAVADMVYALDLASTATAMISGGAR